jgi:hypothetical protein
MSKRLEQLRHLREMSKLIEQLRYLPEFNKFEAAVKEKLSFKNNRRFDDLYEAMYDELDMYDRRNVDSEFEDEVIDEYLESGDDGVDDLICEDLKREVVDLCLALIKEIRW